MIWPTRFADETTATEHPLGAQALDNSRCAFTVWAPRCERVEVVLCSTPERKIPLQRRAHGYFEAVADNVEIGAKYWLELNASLRRPDPASRFQPEGVHGPSAVVPPAFDWTDDRWFGIPLRDYVIYELHVGTFTSEGTFDAIIPHLESLKELGITALELMPVAQFPGSRNWGYDGVGLFAVQNSYGGPAGLKRLVNAAHNTGLAVILDVVYNHLGPEGNYLNDFGPYFTDAYKTFWGPAFNFDQADSDHVRRFFIENALCFQTEYHIDALRLDAVHAIRDYSAVPFLHELALATRAQSIELNRRFHLIAESDLNDPRVIRPAEIGGYGLDAQWSDDFHHSLHVLLTGERAGYYEDFDGLQSLAETLREGWAYSGNYSAHRKRRHGASTDQTSAKQFVVCAQNHDQIGNRMLGDRLSNLVTFEKLKLAAGIVALSPFIPLLFMGEEYGETAPFLYFISHTDAELVEAVRQGRKREFEAFHAMGEAPDPQAEETFQRSKLRHQSAQEGQRRLLREFHKALFQIRRSHPAILNAEKNGLRVDTHQGESVLTFHSKVRADEVCALLSFNEKPLPQTFLPQHGEWKTVIDSSDARWGGISPQAEGAGSRFTFQPFSFIVLARTQ